MASTFAAVFEIVSFGAIIVLVVLGLGIIASMMGIFNFAQGEFVLLGAYVTYLAYAHGAPVWVGMIAAPFVVGALGFVLEALIIRRFYAAPIVAMLGTYALGLIIRESVRGLIGGFYLTVPEPIGGSIDLGSVHISAWRFTIIVITLLVMGACYLLLARTSFGLRVRATLENPALARASGISTPCLLSTSPRPRTRTRSHMPYAALKNKQNESTASVASTLENTTLSKQPPVSEIIRQLLTQAQTD